MNPFISLCMIVKDESKVLKRCLESVVGIIDEIIIVDTGSIDNTKEIAQNFTNKVYDYKWNNHFSEARNYAASKATGEWILVLDADEYVDREELRNFKEYFTFNHSKFDIYALNIVNFLGENGENVIQHKHVRLYKNNKEIEFHRAIHEQLRYIDPEKIIEIGTVPSFKLYHSGYLRKTTKEKEKSKRNLSLVEQELLNNQRSGFDYYNLANEMRALDDIDGALKTYIKAYQMKKNLADEWVSRCTVGIVECLIGLERYEEALKVSKDAQGFYIKSPDFHYFEGLIYFYQKKYKEAKDKFLTIVNNTTHYKDIIKSQDYKEYIPSIRLGEIYEMEEDFHNAIKYYVNALNYNKYCLQSLYGVMKILSEFHSETEIYNFLNRKIIPGISENYCKHVIAIAMNLNLKQLASLLLENNFNKGDFSIEV